MILNYYLAEKDRNISLFEVKRMAEWQLRYRGWGNTPDDDGLDQARHNLRMLLRSNLCRKHGSLYAPWKGK